MMKIIGIVTISILLNMPQSAYARPSQLVPCNELFNRSKPSALVYDSFVKMLNVVAKLPENRLIFAMLVFPDRKPEQAIIVYKTPSGVYFSESVVSPIDINYSISTQVDDKYKQFQNVPPDAVFDLPLLESRGKRKMSPTTAEAIGRSLETVLGKSKFIEKEFDRKDGYTRYFGIPIRYFIGTNSHCGLMPPVPFSGAADRLADLGVKLEKYVEGKVSERNVREFASKVK